MALERELFSDQVVREGAGDAAAGILAVAVVEYWWEKGDRYIFGCHFGSLIVPVPFFTLTNYLGTCNCSKAIPPITVKTAIMISVK
jgi:hypothetical protein